MKDCIFCRIASGDNPAEIIYQDDQAIAFLDITPHAPGHTLVVPKDHHEDMLATPVELVKHLAGVIKKIAPAIMRGSNAQGFNIGLNNGKSAGQVVGHIHFHIIPRSSSDGLVMWEGKNYEQGEMQKYGERIRLELANLEND